MAEDKKHTIAGIGINRLAAFISERHTDLCKVPGYEHLLSFDEVKKLILSEVEKEV